MSSGKFQVCPAKGSIGLSWFLSGLFFPFYAIASRVISFGGKYSHLLPTDGCSLESNEEWGHGWNPKTERVDERAKGDLGKNAQSHPLALHSLHRPLWHLWPAKHWRNSLGHLLGCWQAGKPNHCNALVCFLKLQICRRGANHSLGDELDWSCRKVLMDFYCEY